jgi:uncharacterized membrane protein (UPF0136 family)
MDKVIVWGYGLLLLAGAFFGGRAGSRVSVIMGVVSAVLVFGGALWAGSSPRAGFLFLILVGGTLAAVFAMRLIKTHQFMPSGMLLISALAFLLYCLQRFLRLP